ncbi:unnamed protein product [Tilletia laevis]|uniref:Uncharacterized protein n=1 Tax=Tilletia laevis TaxID=157183 RepID=A0A9N8LNE4_9BASI|nr:unnamed protein product [Tilletia caries]CAD6919463.1 unnamed protein product [Tilletia laevis]CAD6927541.1 unnamed protein product [Tilletia controversa]CAD6929017.1 unnamed protein product [Tilletia laevis]CAD6961139.1 unnamed protein product [Tilletia caries]
MRSTITSTILLVSVLASTTLALPTDFVFTGNTGTIYGNGNQPRPTGGSGTTNGPIVPLILTTRVTAGVTTVFGPGVSTVLPTRTASPTETETATVTDVTTTTRSTASSSSSSSSSSASASSTPSTSSSASNNNTNAAGRGVYGASGVALMAGAVALGAALVAM